MPKNTVLTNEIIDGKSVFFFLSNRTEEKETIGEKGKQYLWMHLLAGLGNNRAKGIHIKRVYPCLYTKKKILYNAKIACDTLMKTLS